MDLTLLVVFCVISCVLLKTLGTQSPEIKTLCAIAAVTVLTLKFLEGFGEISDAVRTLFDQSGLDEDFLKIIFKSLGICCLTQLGCDVCKDCGENALCSGLELVGKAAMVITALPLFSAAVEIVKSLLI